MRNFLTSLLTFLISVLIVGCASNNEINPPDITGELKQWHKITLTFDGPQTGEEDEENPFLDYRMEVIFTRENVEFKVPGYYAADGNAAESGSKSGNKWQVNFTPGNYGLWNYKVSFLKGKNIAISNDYSNGEKVFFDGATGEIYVEPTDKSGKDFRAKGRLIYDGNHYLQHLGDQSWFLKSGSDSPENFLGYTDFDGTYYGGDGERRIGEAGPNKQLHTYSDHIRDWKPGDPTWQGGKGKGIIGGLNYLSSKGVNSLYMITNNVEGDGKDVFPWINYKSDFTRFDVSKLAQWEIVFTHMDKLGMMCHLLTQETENELLLDSGDTKLKRKLYYRELIARFSHHLGVTWNLGEENGVAPWVGYGQNDRQRKDMASYFKLNNPYKNFVVLHTLPDNDMREEILTKLLGFPYLDGPSLQTEVDIVHEETIKWRNLSDEKGKRWVVCSDEIGPASTGAKPDKDDPSHDEIRHKVLWGNLMGGGGGVEWYFGYEYDHNDLNCESWRSRDALWDQTTLAVGFFQKYIPFTEMKPADNLVLPRSNYCLAKNDEFFLVYIPTGGGSTIKLNAAKTYSIKWFDPQNGGEIILDEKQYSGFSDLNFRIDHENLDKDWVAMIEQIN